MYQYGYLYKVCAIQNRTEPPISITVNVNYNQNNIFAHVEAGTGSYFDIKFTQVTEKCVYMKVNILLLDIILYVINNFTLSIEKSVF